jgi:hypothetical protein
MDARVKISMDTQENNMMDAQEGFALSIRFCGNSKRYFFSAPMHREFFYSHSSYPFVFGHLDDFPSLAPLGDLSKLPKIYAHVISHFFMVGSAKSVIFAPLMNTDSSKPSCL